MLIPSRYRPQHHAEHLPHFAAAHESARRMGERREVFGLRKGGEEFPAEVSISRVDVEGRRMYNAVVRDVTERRHYEVALRTPGEVVAGALPTVAADAGQLQQLFQNLVASALKFRRPDVAPRVEVGAGRETDEAAGPARGRRAWGERPIAGG